MATSQRSRQANTDQSTFWSEAHLASLSASPACEAASPTIEEISRSSILGWLNVYSPALSFGKTSPAYFQVYHTTLPIRVSRQTTWKKGPNGWEQTSTTLSKLMRSAASWPDWQTSGTGGPTEFLTLNTPGWRRGGSVCSLSDVLEVGPVHPRFFLSAKACAGILRRAAKRGKELPTMLHRALEQAAGGFEPPGKPEDKIPS